MMVPALIVQVLDCFYDLADTSSEKRNAAVATLIAEIKKQDSQDSLLVRRCSPLRLPIVRKHNFIRAESLCTGVCVQPDTERPWIWQRSCQAGIRCGSDCPLRERRYEEHCRHSKSCRKAFVLDWGQRIGALLSLAWQLSWLHRCHGTSRTLV